MNRYEIVFEFNCPATDHIIRGKYNEMTGRLDLVPKHALDVEWTRSYLEAYAPTEAFCLEHGINHFYFREVKETLVEAGVDMRTFARIEN